MFTRKIKGVVIASAMSLGLVAFAASPAFASGPSTNGNSGVTASGSVASTISMSGISPTVAFGTLVPGVQSVALGAESVTVSSNDAAGYTFSIIPTGAGFVGTAQPGNSIPDSGNFVIHDNTAFGGENINFTTPGAQVIDGMGGAQTVTYVEDWKLTAPLTTAADTYSQSFAYLALAS